MSTRPLICLVLVALAACTPSDEEEARTDAAPPVADTAAQQTEAPQTAEPSPEPVVVPTGATSELQLQAMEWRNIGPFNGDRGATAAVERPDVAPLHGLELQGGRCARRNDDRLRNRLARFCWFSR